MAVWKKLFANLDVIQGTRSDPTSPLVSVLPQVTTHTILANVGRSAPPELTPKSPAYLTHRSGILPFLPYHWSCYLHRRWPRLCFIMQTREIWSSILIFLRLCHIFLRHMPVGEMLSWYLSKSRCDSRCLFSLWRVRCYMPECYHTFNLHATILPRQRTMCCRVPLRYEPHHRLQRRLLV